MAGGADEDPGRGAARDGAVTDADDTRSSGDSAVIARRVEVLAGVRRLLKELDARRHA